MRGAYYNEIDPYAAQWLRNLIAAGQIAPGDVDDRDIRDVRPDDLRGYTQAHFFAGIGGWSYALRLAGWPDDEPVWTGSCPCQPLSVAGQRQGHVDERHLWPAFHGLIAECRPATVFGEQVASKDGREWFAAVRADLEADGYACGGADLCAAGVGAPHIRQRLFWVADSYGRAGGQGRALNGWRHSRSHAVERARHCGGGGAHGLAYGDDTRLEVDGVEQARGERAPVERGGASGGLALPEHAERWALDRNREDGRDGQDGGRTEAHGEPGTCGQVRWLANADGRHASAEGIQRSGEYRQQPVDGRARRMGHAERIGPGRYAGASVEAEGGARLRAERDAARSSGATRGSDEAHGGWHDADWLLCQDGKWRPVEPGTFPLASGLPARVGRLRGYGNAIIPQVAAEFIAAATAV